ncbi:MAG TPA: pyridoxamine 5'-phosphate oxidase family protein [Candidatus Saccharimonadales bacterium]|nr:pyridoxamine 5'-phosphate oxidase family protein [Candidatus Saccharimonadales bacterium]
MPNPELLPRIERAKELLRTVRHAALATVNEDGSPHNSPVFAGFDEQLRMYWASNPESQHSKNIARTGQGFIVLFDSLQKGGGLYLKVAAHVVSDKALAEGVAAFNKARERILRESVVVEDFTHNATQRLYCAEPLTAWVNLAERDPDGKIVRDNRYEIPITAILS